jgi:hypothetical protein
MTRMNYFAIAAAVVVWRSALPLGILLWIGFPVVLLCGSILWQNLPWILTAIHANDWFAKILLVSLIVAGW